MLANSSAVKWQTGFARMRHNYRGHHRYFVAGRVRLEAGKETLEGRLFDVSLDGVGFDSAENSALPALGRRTWLCTLASPDLPQDIRCLVRVVRRQSTRLGSTFGCRIIEIDATNLALLKAYRALAMARGNPLQS